MVLWIVLPYSFLQVVTHKHYVGNCLSIDIDDCLSSPCNNGATCLDGVHKYTFLCSPGFTGITCQKGQWLDYN